MADPVERELFEIDPTSGSLERTLSLDLQPSAIATGDGALWVAGYDNATVEKLDPASGRVIGRVHVGDGPAALAFAPGSLWVANSLDSTVSRDRPDHPRGHGDCPGRERPDRARCRRGSGVGRQPVLRHHLPDRPATRSGRGTALRSAAPQPR